MLKKIFFIGLIGSFLFACGSNPATNVNSTNVNSNPVGAGNVANTTNTSANANANNANVAAKPAVDNSPKRIAFSKGANWGATNITLAPGASQKFVVNAKSGQTMDVEVSSKETSVNLIKGKAQTTEDFGFLSAELQTNGDYIFEVRNSTKKEVKTSVKVTIEGGKVKADEIDESDSTVKDDADVLPPPAKTPSKKEN